MRKFVNQTAIEILVSESGLPGDGNDSFASHPLAADKCNDSGLFDTRGVWRWKWWRRCQFNPATPTNCTATTATTAPTSTSTASTASTNRHEF